MLEGWIPFKVIKVMENPLLHDIQYPQFNMPAVFLPKPLFHFTGVYGFGFVLRNIRIRNVKPILQKRQKFLKAKQKVLRCEIQKHNYNDFEGKQRRNVHEENKNCDMW